MASDIIPHWLTWPMDRASRPICGLPDLLLHTHSTAAIDVVNSPTVAADLVLDQSFPVIAPACALQE